MAPSSRDLRKSEDANRKTPFDETFVPGTTPLKESRKGNRGSSQNGRTQALPRSLPGYTVAMNLAFAETELPVRLRFERPMTNAELLRFCEANEVLRVERDANGEILVMTPAGFGNSKMNVRISRLLDEWAEA